MVGFYSKTQADPEEIKYNSDYYFVPKKGKYPSKNNYCEVLMKLFLGLSLLVLVSTASANTSEFFRCISREEAVSLASTNIEALRKEIREKSSFWVPRQTVREYINLMQFSEHDGKYVSGPLAKWTCAAGSDCYVGVEVSCDGTTGTYLYAD